MCTAGHRGCCGHVGYGPGCRDEDDEEGGKNMFEEDFFRAQLKRLKKEDIKFSYNKILNHQDGQQHQTSNRTLHRNSFLSQRFSQRLCRRATRV